MKLSDIINEDLILDDLKSCSLKEVFEETISHLKSIYKHIDQDQIVKALWNREQEKTTVRSCHFAIPRARVENFNEFTVLIARSKEGIDCGAVDGQKTHLFFFLIGCTQKNKILIQTKKAIYELARNAEKREALMSAANKTDIINIFENSEVHVTKTLTAFDIMNPQVTYVTPDISLKECANIFYQHGISGAPVINETGEILGMVTEKELIKIGLPPYLDLMGDLSFLKEFKPFEEFFKQENNITVKEIYRKDFTTVAVDTPIIEIAFLVTSKNIRRLFVVDGKKLIGIIMRRDLISQVLHS